MISIGSENAGWIVVPVTSVGGSVAADPGFDVHIVRKPVPAPIDGLRRPTSDSLPVE